jgi:hypothetical protein
MGYSYLGLMKFTIAYNFRINGRPLHKNEAIDMYPTPGPKLILRKQNTRLVVGPDILKYLNEIEFPTLAEFFHWHYTQYCESITGHIVESYGSGPDGFHSWLIYIDMITKKTFEALLNELLGNDYGTTLRIKDPLLFDMTFFDYWLSLRPEDIHEPQPRKKIVGQSVVPRMINARFDSKCARCRTDISKGNNCYYWPTEKRVYCYACGEADYSTFFSTAKAY